MRPGLWAVVGMLLLTLGAGLVWGWEVALVVFGATLYVDDALVRG